MTWEKTHRGHTITITPDGDFLCDHPNLSGKRFSSIRETKDAIDEAIKAALAQEKAAAKIAVPALTYEGRPTVVRGLHSGNGRVLTDIKDYENSIFPDLPWLKERLVRRAQLKAEIIAITKEVEAFGVRGRAVYGRVDAARYADVLDNWLKKLADAEVRARAQEPAAATAPTREERLTDVG